MVWTLNRIHAKENIKLEEKLFKLTSITFGFFKSLLLVVPRHQLWNSYKWQAFRQWLSWSKWNSSRKIDFDREEIIRVKKYPFFFSLFWSFENIIVGYLYNKKYVGCTLTQLVALL